MGVVSHGEVFLRHPLCTCGSVTFFSQTAALVTRDGCRYHAKSIYGIDPHPVLSSEDLEEIMEAFLTNSRRERYPVV